ncbi:MAG: oligopeptidase A [Legionellales bacterium]|nr:oligopeptidase A [Legionellales bacterium]
MNQSPENSIDQVLEYAETFNWKALKPEAVLPVLTALIVKHRAQVNEILSRHPPTWDTTLGALAELDEVLDRFWSMISHLKHVVSRSGWSAVYAQALELITQYSLERALDPLWLKAVTHLSKSTASFSEAQQSSLALILRDFKLSGMFLPPEDQDRIKAISAQLSQLSAQVSMQVLAATDATRIWVRSSERLAGLSSDCVDQARERASQQGRSGWCFSIEDADCRAIMQTAQDRALRRQVFQAHRRRASSVTPQTGDNGPLMVEMLSHRQAISDLLGFETYAHQVLEARIAENVEHVKGFLDDFAERVRPQAQQEWSDLKTFAATHLNLKRLQPWDVAYAMTQFETHTLGVDPQAYRPYFPLSAVIKGLHQIIGTVLGLSISIESCEAWAPEVQCWRIQDDQQGIDARCWVDLFARPGKQGGAWMDECQTRWRNQSNQIVQPMAFLTCNFMPPNGSNEAQLTHEEVLTLFHEFGHTLHHCLSQVDVPDISGISGVAWDAVEVPSQLFECWCWTQEGLDLISQHVETGETLPKVMIEALQQSRQFMAATALMRQIALSQFDWALHAQRTTWTVDSIYGCYQDIMRAYTCTPVWTQDCMPAAFTHIFAGGYAAGYYSYLFAEVMSDDAFARFEEEGLMNPEVGRALRDYILSQGAVKSADVLFKAFRGRAPTMDALLRHRGLAT